MIRKLGTFVGLAAALGAFAGGTSAVAAQENLLEMVRSDVRADAQQITALAMALPDAEAQKFWPVYREYELERSKWFDMRLATIRAYAENYETMSDEKAAELADAAFEILQARLVLFADYYERFAEEVGPATALRWVQVENQLHLIADIQFAQEVPLVFKTGGN